jgi:hypothetical protein
MHKVLANHSKQQYETARSRAPLEHFWVGEGDAQKLVHNNQLRKYDRAKQYRSRLGRRRRLAPFIFDYSGGPGPNTFDTLASSEKWG